ncbi:TrbI F-type domain-containing protein [Legionella sp. WA2024007413]
MRLSHTVVVSVVTILFIGLQFWISPKTNIVLFDSAAIQAQLVRQLAEHQANEKQVSHTTQQIKQKLHLLLTQYAKQHHVIIFDQREVLAGGENITSEIANKLSQTMRKSS